MTVSKEFIAFVCDHFSELGEINSRYMFGGAGVYAQGVMFALIASDTLYVKIDPQMKTELHELGCGPFMYDPGNGKEPKSMGYWTIPESAMDDPHEAVEWGQRALQFALSKQKKK